MFLYPLAAAADVFPPTLEYVCDPANSQLSLRYLWPDDQPRPDAELIRFHDSLIGQNGEGWAEKTITRTCTGPDNAPVTVSITGKPVNSDNANGTCGEVFYAQVMIRSGNEAYFAGPIDGMPSSETTCTSGDALSIRIDFDLTTRKTTLTPPPFAP